jgi:hypothetical protein
MSRNLRASVIVTHRPHKGGQPTVRLAIHANRPDDTARPAVQLQLVAAQRVRGVIDGTAGQRRGVPQRFQQP